MDSSLLLKRKCNHCICKMARKWRGSEFRCRNAAIAAAVAEVSRSHSSSARKVIFQAGHQCKSPRKGTKISGVEPQAEPPINKDVDIVRSAVTSRLNKSGDRRSARFMIISYECARGDGPYRQNLRLSMPFKVHWLGRHYCTWTSRCSIIL